MSRQLSTFGNIVLMLLMVAVASISGGAAAVLSVKYLYDAEKQTVPVPAPDTLSVQAAKVLTVDGNINQRHALYLSRLFQGLAMRLVVDANSSHRFNTTSELAALVSDAGLFAVQGVRGFDYPELPIFIKEQILVPSFGEPAVDKQVTPNETLDFADTLTRVSAAFNIVSEK